MLYVNLQAQANSARQNMHTNSPLQNLPAGWVTIPEALEQEALGYLPYLDLTLDQSGTVIAVSQAAHETPEKQEQPIDDITRIELALAELASMMQTEA